MRSQLVQVPHSLPKIAWALVKDEKGEWRDRQENRVIDDKMKSLNISRGWRNTEISPKVEMMRIKELWEEK